MADHTIEINEQDPATAFGLFFRDGTYQELLKIPTRKAGLQQNWPDEDGTEVDNVNVYESRSLALPVAIEADDEETLLWNYQAFVAMLLGGSALVLDAYFLNRRFVLRYTDVSDVIWTDTVVTLTLHVVDDYPTSVTPIP